MVQRISTSQMFQYTLPKPNRLYGYSSATAITNNVGDDLRRNQFAKYDVLSDGSLGGNVRVRARANDADCMAEASSHFWRLFLILSTKKFLSVKAKVKVVETPQVKVRDERVTPKIETGKPWNAISAVVHSTFAGNAQRVMGRDELLRRHTWLKQATR